MFLYLFGEVFFVRVILHCDMNSFYASVEMLYQPHLRTVPLAVGGDEEKRHGIVLAKMSGPRPAA